MVFNIFKFWKSFFNKKKKISIGLYGPPNSGKTTLANKILKDILGENVQEFSTSNIEHETREIQNVDNLTMEKDGKKISFNLIDTPGIATKIDFEDFLKKGIKKKTEAKKRAKEATQGIIESIKWIDKVDLVLIILDLSKNPYNQVNITLIANIVAKGKKMIIVGNKADLKKANIEKVKITFPKNKIIGISALKGTGIKNLYSQIFKEI